MAEFLYKELTHEIIGAAIEVHRTLGPGFPEKVYQASLEHELGLHSLSIEPQKQVNVTYKGVPAAEYFIDILVEAKVIVELKALSDLEGVHESQVIAYLKASRLRLGLLLNFGKQRLQTKRIIL
jgi:GxxExxY protein